MLNIFSKKNIKDRFYGAVSPTKKIRVYGIPFEIKKIDVLDHLAGSSVLRKEFDTYKTSGMENQTIEASLEKKMRKHYIDVFMSGIVAPKLDRKKDDQSDNIPVDDLFLDWGLANELYEKIIEFTYDKKKLLF